MQVNPNKLTRDFIEFIRVLPKFKRNEVVLTLEEDVPDIAMDVDQLQQVLLNLANNAVEACSDARLEFSTSFDRNANTVRWVVKDNGPGIDAAFLEKLLREKITTKADGHGFGLPICRQIVEDHGGTMRVETSNDGGAAFIMTFSVVHG
jgi:signal transduction histidine kinase